ncbi:MAG TPA: BTAD domain-containing putative transcriptional regulator [Longimicrobiales bacterium]
MIELHVLGTTELRAADGRPLQAVLRQPKRFALLAYLAAASPCGFHRRDVLLAMFWPESDAGRARTSLRKAVHLLRQDLGAGVLVGRGDEELGIAPGALRCDAAAFRDALDGGDAAAALELYRGDLLPGFFLSGAPEFERWLDAEREALRRRAAGAAWAVAEAAEAAGQVEVALARARQAARLGGDDEISVRRALAVHDRLGDRLGALRLYDEYRRRLAEDYALEPSAEIVAAVEAIRSRAHGGTVPPADPPAGEDRRESGPGGGADGATETAAGPARAASAAGVPGARDRGADSRGPPPPGAVARAGAEAARPRSGRRSTRWPASMKRVTAAAGVLAVAVLAALAVRRGVGEPPVLAVGAIRDFTADAAPAPLDAAVRDLLATGLARGGEIQVVSTARLYELLAQDGASVDSPAAVAGAARRAGATELIEGAVHRLPGGAIRLDLRQVSLETGAVQRAYTSEGEDAFRIAEQATSQILRHHGRPASRAADVSTPSPVAYRLYDEGLRVLYDGDPYAARRFFDAALAEDSTFATAAYYAAESAFHVGHRDTGLVYLERALRRVDRVAEREQLLIRGAWAAEMNEPDQLDIARLLATRYPLEPDGHLLLGRALVWAAGDFMAAVPHLRRVMQMDSLGFSRAVSRCRACAAANELVWAYMLADSMAAAERDAREWVARMPRFPRALDALANTLEFGGRHAEALSVRRALARVERGGVYAELVPGVLAMRDGNFASADEVFRRLAADSRPEAQHQALWYLIISLRYQGRLREALEAARELRRRGPAGSLALGGEIAQAIVLREMGRHREAAALFDSVAAASGEPRSSAQTARRMAWHRTHAAEAWAAAGDTARVRLLADSIESLGRRSGYARDRRLHHHLRGLIHLAGGRAAEAERELRQAVFSWSNGYTRTNFELGRLLLAGSRPHEAIPVLRAAFHGPVQSSNLYITHTDLHELLGRAFEAAGEPDSAAAHYRWVLRALRDADPAFHARRDSARARLATLDARGALRDRRGR